MTSSFYPNLPKPWCYSGLSWTPEQRKKLLAIYLDEYDEEKARLLEKAWFSIEVVYNPSIMT